jgi:hypothetical protein
MELLPKKYTLNEINDISFTGFEFILNNDILLLIEELTNKVSSPSYIKTPIFNKRIKKNPIDNIHFSKKNEEKTNQKKKIKEILNDDDWDLLSSFEVTKIDKKEGIDTELIHIRSLLNMLTESNFNVKHENIIIILDKLDVYSLEEQNKIYNIIIDITSGNSFYSDIYAKLFSKLSEKYKILIEIFISRTQIYLNNYEFIKTNNNESYDEMCKINKENDKSEAFSLFLINLEKYNVIKKEIIVDIIDKLLKKLLFYLKDCLYKNMVDKIIENLFILYKKEWVKDISINENNIIVKMNTTKLIKCIVENININIYPGISNKSKSYFKLIDILEK